MTRVRAGHQTVQRHAVIFHELDQLRQRNAAVFAAWNAVARQRAGIEPFADGARGNVANLGDFAGGEHVFELGRSWTSAFSPCQKQMCR